MTALFSNQYLVYTSSFVFMLVEGNCFDWFCNYLSFLHQ